MSKLVELGLVTVETKAFDHGSSLDNQDAIDCEGNTVDGKQVDGFNY